MKTEEDLCEHGSLDYVAGLLDGVLLTRKTIGQLRYPKESRSDLEGRVSNALRYLEEKLTQQKFILLGAMVENE